MKPYQRSRPIPPPASCRSGPGSREVSPDKWNLLRDEDARPCVLNSWWEIRRTMCRPTQPRRLSASPCGPCSAGRISIGRSGYGRIPDGCVARHSPTSSNRRSSTFVRLPCSAPGARQDCERSAGHGVPNLRSHGRVDSEISQEKQEFAASGPPVDLPWAIIPTQPIGRRAAAPTNPERWCKPTSCFCAIPPVAGSISWRSAIRSRN